MEIASIPLNDILKFSGILFGIGSALITALVFALKYTFKVAQMVTVWNGVKDELQSVKDELQKIYKELQSIVLLHKELDDKVRQIDTRVARLEVKVEHNTETVRMVSQ